MQMVTYQLSCHTMHITARSANISKLGKIRLLKSTYNCRNSLYFKFLINLRVSRTLKNPKCYVAIILYYTSSKLDTLFWNTWWTIVFCVLELFKVFYKTVADNKIMENHGVLILSLRDRRSMLQCLFSLNLLFTVFAEIFKAIDLSITCNNPKNSLWRSRLKSSMKFQNGIFPAKDRHAFCRERERERERERQRERERERYHCAKSLSEI